MKKTCHERNSLAQKSGIVKARMTKPYHECPCRNEGCNDNCHQKNDDQFEIRNSVLLIPLMMFCLIVLNVNSLVMRMIIMIAGKIRT